jgi:MoaA/NifB/PqqE/SkfB family radical SAM enzyme
VTKRCPWLCLICFYRHQPWFNTPEDKSLADAMSEVVMAKQRGCDHAVLVGEGETSLWPHLIDFIGHCKEMDITTSIITNGASPVARYEKMYEAGLNHLHISVHGVGPVLDAVADVPGAGERQAKVLEWLKETKLPWRSNTTLQLVNYKSLPETTQFIIDHGAYHIVLLGFLPHYSWGSRLREVAVHPAELRAYVEQSLDLIIKAGRYATLRYHPMCELPEDLRKYATNARYVLYDPGEWEYGYCGLSDVALWDAAVNSIGGSVAIKGRPCCDCTHFMHCGGWNQTYANGFEGAGLEAIMTPIDQTPGFLHDQNPFNATKGYV